MPRPVLRTLLAALALTTPLVLGACAGGEGEEGGGEGGSTEQEGGEEDDGDGY